MRAPREFPRLALTEAISNIDLHEDAKICNEYDGRGIFRPVSFGVTVPSVRDALRLAAALGAVCGAEVDSEDEQDALLPDLVNELMASAQLDNMGHDVILYFEGWRLDS